MSIVSRRAFLAAVMSLLVASMTFVVWTTAPASAAITDLRINEVESNGGTPDDWVELYNTGTAAVDISGLIFRDNDNTHTFAIPASTSIAAGGFYVLDTNTASTPAGFNFGLGSADSARLFGTDGTTLLDSFTWTAHAATTYGRCPDGTGAFITTTASTKGTTNSCGGSPTTTTTVPSGALPWPGDAAIQTADNLNVFGGNLSGLVYEGSGSATPGILWGARNGPGTLFRLVLDGTTWVPDPANGWGTGKLVHYPDGTGNPDAEGVTIGGPTAADGLYVSTERNNDANGLSRNSILRFDVTGAGSSLTATREWDLTADLPPVGPNLGAEAITWIPDSFLVSQGFLDESKGHAYSPAEYANHGTGLFFVGLEANGTIYAYALDHVGGGFTRVATISSGFIGVMDLQFDRDLHDLWAVCDDGCLGRSAVLRVSPSTGKFTVSFVFDRPGSMPNLNNEGFAIAAATECVGNRKPVYWADDSETDGHAIRRGNLPCATLTTPPTDIPEFPFAVLSGVTAAALFGGWLLIRRRRHPV